MRPVADTQNSDEGEKGKKKRDKKMASTTSSTTANKIEATYLL
jgi:hypothetical protein